MVMTRITPQLLWQLGRVGRPVASRDGSTVVTSLTRYDTDTNESTSQIFEIGKGEPRPITSASQSASQPALSDDGQLLAFVRKVDDVRQIHVMPTTGGDPRPVTDVPIAAIGPRWLPDGSGLVFLSMVYRDALSLDEARAQKTTLADTKTSALVTEDRMYRYWDRWLVDGQIPHLFRLDLDSQRLTDLTPTSTDWWVWDNVGDPADMFDVSPDGATIAYSSMPYATDAPAISRVSQVSTEGGEPFEISGAHHADCFRPRFSPDGATIVYGRQERVDFYADRVRLVAYDIAAKTSEVLTERWDRSAGGWEFDTSERVVFLAEDDAAIPIYSMRLDDVEPKQIGSGGSASGLVVANGTVYATVESLRTPAEVFTVNGGAYERVTNFNGAALSQVEVSPVEVRRFEGAAGSDVQMFVVYPPDFDERRKWPLVHMINGGPHGIFGDQWHYRWSAQAIAAAGYVVAHVNFHGSTSWGQSFAESIEGAWGERPFDDVMRATDELVATGFIDEERMAVTGGSYGGYLTAWIVAHTQRFACAIAHAAVTNLGGMHASDVVFHRATAYGAEYWEDHERVDLWSPSTHAGGYSTPTLVIHGEQDYRVPITQGLEFYGVLKGKGVEARLVYYPDENHWILKPRNSIHWYGEFLGWLDRHLQPENV